jgi:putative glycosyltransferase
LTGKRQHSIPFLSKIVDLSVFMKLSIVSTLYKSSPYIERFCARCTKVAEELTSDYEIILVNDGSPDDSLAIARKIQATNPHIVIVDLSRNFGHHKAAMTGLMHTKGEQVFLIDSDLEEDPEFLIPFAERLAQGDADVVYGVQDRRKGKWLERWGGAIYYWLFNKLCDLKIPPNLITARLMTRRYVDALLQHREHELCISGLWVHTGFVQIPLTVRKHSRDTTSYTFHHRVALFVNAITSFTGKPLSMIFYVGVLMLVSSCSYALYLTITKLFFEQFIDGWTSLMVSVWFFSGLIIFFQGIIAIYLSKIHIETKARPYTIVRDVYRK